MHYYNYEESLFFANDKRLTFKIYTSNCIESVLIHINSNNANAIKIRDEFYIPI